MRDELDDEIESLPGDPQAKRRLKVICRLMAGRLSEGEACRILGVTRAELVEMRDGVEHVSIRAIKSFMGLGFLPGR